MPNRNVITTAAKSTEPGPSQLSKIVEDVGATFVAEGVTHDGKVSGFTLTIHTERGATAVLSYVPPAMPLSQLLLDLLKTCGSPDSISVDWEK